MGLMAGLRRARFGVIGRLVVVALALAALGGCALAPSSCLSPPVSGFQPVQPELRQCIYGKFVFVEADVLEWMPVGSTRPTLAWEPVPGRHQEYLGDDRRPFVTADIEDIQDVRYDLRIWSVREELAERLVYERSGIDGTSHRVEEPLQPEMKFYWSVRARFRLDGETRVSEWSLSQSPLPRMYPRELRYSPKELHQLSARELARKIGEIPPLNYYRFETPRR